MNGAGEGGGRPRRVWFRRPGALSAALAGTALLAAACGGSSTPSPPSGGSLYPKALAFTRCMRAHGEPGYPDPTRSPAARWRSR